MIHPAEFLQKFELEFLPELKRRLDNDPKRRGGIILYAGPAQVQLIQTIIEQNGQQIVQRQPPNGWDVQIEDKDGNVDTFYVDPVRNTFIKVN